MKEKYTARQKTYSTQFEAFGRSQVAPRALATAISGDFDWKSWKNLNATDFFRIPVPEEYGGKGHGWWDFIAALEGMAATAADSAFPITAASQAGMLYGLLRFGTEAQKQAYIPRILEGELTATAIAEEDSGSNPRRYGLAAKEVDGRLHLTGSDKWHITHAQTAGFSLVPGRHMEARSPRFTLFLVDHAQEGIETGATPEKLGHRGLPTGFIRFNDVAMDDAQILGNKDAGMHTLAQITTLTRTLFGLIGTWLPQPAILEALAFLNTRGTGRGPLLKQQYVTGRFVNIHLACTQARSLAHAALDAIFREDPHATGMASMAKIAGANAFRTAMLEVQQLMGTRGYLEGMVTHLLRDALGYFAIGGTEEMHKHVIYRDLLAHFRDENS